MWEPFTEPARRAMVRAQELAQQHGDAFISQHHIFVALTDDADVAQILAALGAGDERVREAAEKTLGAEAFKPAQEMVFTPEAKRMIELAFDNARRLENNFIGAEHLALGYLALGPKHIQVIAALGVEPEKFRELLIASLEKQPKHRPGTPQRGKSSFEHVYRKAGNFEGRRTTQDMWHLVQSAAEQRDLASVFVHALSIAARESIAPDELLRHIDIRLGE